MAKNSTKFPPGTWLEKDLVTSEAYLSLKGVAPQLLTLFYLKRQFKTFNNGKRQERVCINSKELKFTHNEAEKDYGITGPRFVRGIDDLLAKGFIKIEHLGGCYQKDQTVYWLSDSWRLWQPRTVFEKRERDVERGFCKPKKQN